MKDALRRALNVEATARGHGLPAGLVEQVCEDLDTRTHELRELFGDRPPLALVGFDTPGIQDYVFKVRRPVDLFGGSLLVAHFTHTDEHREVSLYRYLADARVAVPPSAVVFAGGGGGLLIVATSQADAVVRFLEGILRQATENDLRTVATVLEVWPEELSAALATLPEGLEAVGPLRSVSRYSATIQSLTARCSRERARQARFATPVPRHRHAQRCDACNQRVAVDTRPVGEAEEHICTSCRARWRYGSRHKRDTDQPQTFEDMVRGLPDTSLAVLYADGANVGRAFQRLESIAQHRALSRAVDAAMLRARQEALSASPWLAGDEGYRWQIAISGGDDLVLILPALAVPDAVGPLVRTFEAHFDLEQNAELRRAFEDAPQALHERIGDFGLGVGIAVADIHFPVRFLVQYARQLLKSAKKRIRQGERSAVDFLVLRSGTPLSEHISDLRERCFRRAPEGKRPGLWLTRRPFGVDEFVDLVRRTRLLNEHVPPSQVHAMRQEIDRGGELSRSLWRYQHARAKEGEGWAAYREALGRDLADVDSLLWTELPPEDAEQADPPHWLATDYLDALDLSDLVLLPLASPEGTVVGLPEDRRNAV